MNYITKLFALLFIVSLASCSQKETQTQTDHLKLWYNQPATDWQSEALPIGNGFMGTMFFGGIEKEQIQFAEGTLWSGGPGSGDEYNYGIKKDAWKHLAEVRRLLDEGKMDEAHELANRELTGSMYKDPDSKSSFGNYGGQQTMGDLFIEVKHEGEVSDYIRELDIEKAEGRVSYTIGDAQYSRTYFANYPSKTMVYRFESNTATDYSLTYKTPHIKNTESFSNATYSFQGHVEDNGMEFETRLKFETDGNLEFKDGVLTVSGAKYVNIYHVAATEYTTDYPTYNGNDYVAVNNEVLQRIEGKSFDVLRTEHQNDFSELFDRVELDLGENKRDNIPTGKRLIEYSKGISDAGLEELYFQYSRYLMIAASRPGGMPLNLQGKWNNSTNPRSEEHNHMNINQQMLYWPAEVTNLSECHVPLFDYMETLVEPGRISAKEFFNTRGWIVNTMNNPFGYTSPGWNFPWGFYPGGAGWLCQHLWEHYEFTQDKKFLKETAYPMIKEAALFWIDYLIEDENGYLVSSPSYSPEHGGISRGASMDHQIAWDLLNNCIAATNLLGIDEEFQKEAKILRDKIAPPTIGSWGQLQEWKEDVDDPESKHRHVSHLYAIHPGKQLSVEKTPKFAEAAKVTLNARGDDGTGWSLAWKVNFWSRLKDGDRAYKLYRRLLQPIDTKKGGMIGGTYTNLLCGHPPFQLDGNMGGAAGMAEMLLQSRTGSIELLPALPAAWKNGSVKGLKARGGFKVSVEWRDGKLEQAEIITVKDGFCEVKYGDKKERVQLNVNEKLIIKSDF